MFRNWRELYQLLNTTENKHLYRQFLWILFFITFLVFGCAIVVWRLEQHGSGSLVIKTFLDGIWWAVVTIATVGYGDKVPVTLAGRLVGMILIAAGFILLSLFTGIIAAVLIEDRMKSSRGLKMIIANHHLVVCGWNTAAESMLKTMVEKEKTDLLIVLVGNYDVTFFEALISRFPSLNLRFVRGEPTEEETLKKASVYTASQVIILMDDSLPTANADDRSIIITNAVHYLAGKARITVQLSNGNNKHLLRRLGVDEIIVADEIGGRLLANNVLDVNYFSFHQELMQGHQKHLMTVPAPNEWVGKHFSEIFQHYYMEEDSVVLGVVNEKPQLSISEIFADDTSAIDGFIRSSLSQMTTSGELNSSNVIIQPGKDYTLSSGDQLIIMSAKKVLL